MAPRLKAFRLLKPVLSGRRALAGDRSGAAAVEFALVAAPLIFMLFSIIELGLVFVVSATLENATSDAARAIRTGQVQGGPATDNTANALRDKICGKLGWLQGQCTDNLSVDVRTFAQFSNQSAPSPINNGKFDSTKLVYQPGGPGDIVLVRAFYRWTLFTPFLNGALANLDGGVAMLQATATFENEPYG